MKDCGMRSCQDVVGPSWQEGVNVLKSYTVRFPRNLIKTNRKEAVVMSGQVYSNAAPPPLSKDGLGEEKTKTTK